MFASASFKASELRCKCSRCNKQVPHKVKRESLDLLQRLRDAYGKPLVITSAYRCEKHPAESGKANPGQHNKGTAFDISVSDGAMAFQIMKLAFDLGFTGIALGNGFVHVDTRTSTPVSWRY